MKDHSKHIELYTPLTDHAVSIHSNGGLSKNHGPYGLVTLRYSSTMKNHYNDIELYSLLTIHVVSIIANDG